MPPSSPFLRARRATLSVAVLAALLAGCATPQPRPLTSTELTATNRDDTAAMRKDVEPIGGPLTLDEAMARALKYNLDRRARLMEEAIALGQLDVARFDMLPRVLAQAGYQWRDNDLLRLSRDPDTGLLSPSRFISQERAFALSELTTSWSLLDFGMGYYGARQAGDRLLVATERRRKAMHLLTQDVRTAYWRAAAAQLLRDDVARTIVTAEAALEDSRKAENERLRNPLDPLRYQRQLLENLRLLEAISQELSAAQVELASLINAPLGEPIRVAETDIRDRTAAALALPVERLEATALLQNADLREQHLNARVARDETRRTMVRMFPNLTFSYSLRYNTDSFLVNQSWQDASLQLSTNLMNLLTGPTQMRLARAGVALADQRRMAVQMAVLTQVHLSRLQLANAKAQYDRAEAILSTDRRISELMRRREAAAAQSKLDVVANDTSAILSLLRRFQALTQVQTAESRLMASLGLEPRIDATRDVPLATLAMQLREAGDPWTALAAAPNESAPAVPAKP